MGWKLVTKGPRQYYELEMTEQNYHVRDSAVVSNSELEQILKHCDGYVDALQPKLVTWTNDLVPDEVMLPAGFYDFYPSQGYPSVSRLELKNIREEEAYTPTTNVDVFNADLKMFINSKYIYEEMKVMYRRGYLLYGPPGNGKTALIRSILKRVAFDNAQIIWCHDVLPESFREKLNSTTNLKVLVFEELVNQDGSSNYGVQSFLDMLDGENSLNNCIVIATTNYPELLAKNLADRPSRFDMTIEVGYPDKASATQLLRMFLKDTSVDTESLDLTELSVAHLKEIALVSKMYKIELNAAVKKIRAQSGKFKDNFAHVKSFGFTKGDE